MNIEDTIQERLNTPDSAVMQKARSEILQLRAELSYARHLLLEAFNDETAEINSNWLNKVAKLFP